MSQPETDPGNKYFFQIQLNAEEKKTWPVVFFLHRRQTVSRTVTRGEKLELDINKVISQR